MISLSVLERLALVNRLLSYKYYFLLLTEVGRANGTYTTKSGTPYYIQRQESSLIEARDLVIRAGLSKYKAESYAALRNCIKCGLISTQATDGKSYPFLHRNDLVMLLRTQVLLLSGSNVDLHAQLAPFEMSLEASEEKLLDELKSVGSICTLFALPSDFTAQNSILDIMHSMYEPEADPQPNAHLQAFIRFVPPLAIAKEVGRRKLYKRNNDEVDAVILLFKRLVVHFSQL